MKLIIALLFLTITFIQCHIFFTYNQRTEMNPINIIAVVEWSPRLYFIRKEYFNFLNNYFTVCIVED